MKIYKEYQEHGSQFGYVYCDKFYVIEFDLLPFQTIKIQFE